ncbi:hypothetical protein BX666DRAFT_1570789 [Dichotomocladium elegans]|nr:hypothetical protein BX666DRAFT_1570789 [Dichotomocladium elegans]
MTQYKQPGDGLRIWLPDNGQIISYQGETIPFQGSVILENRVARIKKITVKLEGRMKVHLQGTGYKNDKLVYEKTWHLLPPSKSYRRFESGQEWHFSGELPSSLPPSIIDQDGGQYAIVYQLKAIAERPPFQPNFSTKRQVHISRYLRMSAATTRLHPQVFRDLTDLMEYGVGLRTGSIWRPGSTIPIDIHVFRTREDVVRLRSVRCRLNSYVFLSCESTKAGKIGSAQQKRQGRTLAYLRDDHVVRQGIPLPWKKTELLKIPNHVPVDVNTAMIHIKHKLKVSIVLLRESGQTEEIITSFPIIINNMDEEVVRDDNSEEDRQLPAYHETHSSTLCDPLTCRPVILSTSTNSSHSSSDASSPSSSNPEANGEQYDLQENRFLLARVPSYKTVGSNRCSITPSLPAYD